MKSQNRDVQEKPVRPSHGLSTLRPSTAILAGCTAMFAATTTIADAAAAPATPSNAISQAIRRLPTNGITTPDSAKGARLGIVAEPVDPGKHIDGMAHGDKPGYNNPHSDSMGTRHVDYTEWLILHGDYREPIHFDTPIPTWATPTEPRTTTTTARAPRARREGGRLRPLSGSPLCRGDPPSLSRTGLECSTRSKRSLLRSMNAYPTHASRRRAFTIIELLVVIAIVAVLAAILFPVFAHARQSARQTQCLSNLRSLGLAVQLYASEDDDAYLARTDAFGEENPGYEARASQFSWLVALMPYARDAALARCPTAVDGARVFALSDGRRRYDLPEKHLGVNGFLAVNFLIDPKASVVKTTEVGRPAELPLLADSAYVAFGHPDYVIQANYDANPTDSESLLTDPKRPQNRIDPRLSRHAGGSNVLYCDLHARRRAQAAMGLDPARASLPDAQRFLLPVDPADDRVR